ncbi:MAG: undecaprenyl/decaprenyl-phosphate alpha-N-acetylglucosaminyl 1-phosphate transferase, partial [Planctomycetes bacterium]|nr:undecaprenyl/decaprenyl-phosphate alpha-N-acetylglucosaminyl 1-phosphate transferase [Planctomycetota bacterium]
RWVALRWNVVDRPDQAVKIHRTSIPYLGGCAIWLAWTVPMIGYGLLAQDVDWQALGALLVGGTVAFVTGLVDDVKEIDPRTKLLGQAAAAAILLLGGIRWAAFPNLTWLPALQLPEGSLIVIAVCLVVHFLVVIGATNATNLLDGLDGLCSGVTVTISIGFLLLATSLTAWANPEWVEEPVRYEHSALGIAVTFALAGAAIGFLPYNFPPARIFMGDAGSIFIGFVLAAMMIIFAGVFGVVKWFVGALFIFGLPIFDTGLALVRRVGNHRSIMMPDRSHLYNQMIDRLGLSVRATFGILLVGSIVFAAAGLLVLYSQGRFAALVYVGIALAFIVVVWRLRFLRMTPAEKAAADRYLNRRRSR